MNVLKMLFLFSKSAPMCKSLWACAGENSERIKALECAALVCIWSGRSLGLFSRKLGTHKAWKDMYLYVNLKPVSVDTGLWEPMVSFGQVERGLSFERNISWVNIRKNLGPFVWFRSVPSIKKKKNNNKKNHCPVSIERPNSNYAKKKERERPSTLSTVLQVCSVPI